MKGLFIRWIVSAVALYLTALLSQWVSGLLPAWANVRISLEGWLTPLFAVAVLAIINALIRPLVLVLTLPLNCLTLGIFTFVVNALMFWLVGSLVPGFEVEGPLAAIFGSIVMGIIAGMANQFISPKEK